MKATVLQENLAHGLNTVSRAVASRSTLPVLSNILVATDEGRLRLSATNLELGITYWIGPASSKKARPPSPHARSPTWSMRSPPTRSAWRWTPAPRRSTVRGGTSVNDIKCIDAQEFPPLPVSGPGQGACTSNVADFKEMIQQVAFSASTDEARPVLMGVLLQVNE